MLSNQQLTTIINLQKKLDEKIAQTRTLIDNEEILKAKFLALIVEIAEFANEQRSFKYWSSKPPSAKEILLEEYIDGFHFIISIANNLKLPITKLTIITQEYQDLNLAFLDLFTITLKLEQEKSLIIINKWFNIYYSIAKLCNFSSDDIFDCYLTKNQVNHIRQEQNY